MLTYCVKEKKETSNVAGSEKIVKTKNGRNMMKSICASCGSKKSRFVKKQSGEGLFHAGETLPRAPPRPRKTTHGESVSAKNLRGGRSAVERWWDIVQSDNDVLAIADLSKKLRKELYPKLSEVLP